jgi:hypothetical protein
LYGRENAAWQAAVPIAGGNMTGALVLWADPNTALGAATKQLVDGKVAKIGDTMTGALNLPGNPTQPLQATPKQYVDTRILKTGDTMTGPLVLNADPTAALGAATKQTVDAKVNKAGDTMTGYLTLIGDPTQPLEASTKAYVDAHTPGAITEAPTDSYLYGRVNAVWARTLPLAGGTMTGAITLAADPTIALGAATKQMVDAKVTKAGDTMTGPLVLPADPTLPLQASTKAYVDAHAPGALPEAPTDSYLYGRVNAAWVRGLPLAGGTLTGALALPADPTTPLGAATKQMVDAKVIKAGDTMTGPLVLAADPSAVLGAATKQYVDTRVVRAGDTMTGILTLSADPAGALDAATKQYVDAHVGGITDAPSDAFFYGRINAAWAKGLALAGGTLTGPLVLAADPTSPLQAATKQYSDLRVLKAGDTMTGELTLQGNPVGVLGAAPKQYVDGKVAKTGDTMTGALTLNANPTAALGAATKQYVDAGVAPAFNDIGRNFIHNSMFNIQQRGVGPFTTTGYTADRWQIGFIGGTLSTTVQAVSDADRTGIGDESAQFALNSVFTGTAGAGDFIVQNQPMENVRRLANKTVTVSFWANASATLKVGISLDQNFGTGGSPSANVSGNGTAVTIGTAWARYSVTFTLPSTAGKTLGTTANSSSTILLLWLSSGSTNAVRSGGIGVQSGTVNFWGVQLEVAAAATPLEKPDPQVDLAKCQRFYQISQIAFSGYSTATAQTTSSTVYYPMRITPIATIINNSSSNVSGFTLSVNVYLVYAVGITSVTGGIVLNAVYSLSADF